MGKFLRVDAVLKYNGRSSSTLSWRSVIRIHGNLFNKILLVAEDQTLFINITQKLGKKGIAVVTAESMSEGMHILQNENGFDAIIAEMDGKNSEGINLSTKCYGRYPILLLGEDEFSSLPNRVLNHSDSYIEKKHLNKHIIDGMLLAIDNWRGRHKMSA